MHEIDAVQRALYPLLYLPSRLYAAMMRFRRTSYETGALQSFRPPCTTISVGNICWGGTGKTPLVDWITGWALRQGMNPAILTRGYKAVPPALPYHVREESTPQEAGDEPLLLARTHLGASVVVDPDRVRGAEYIIAYDKPDLMILDDGFQHLAIKRDLDLVLLKPADLMSDWNRVIPAGPWREGETALLRADAFLIKCPPDEFQALEPLVKEYLGPYRKPVFNFSMALKGLVRLDRGGTVRNLDGAPYALVSGVGEPDQVAHTAEALMGNAPAKHLRYEDHHAYTQADWDFISQQAMNKNAEHVVCTSKDAVKLAGLETSNLWTFDTTVTFGSSYLTKLTFPDWWRETMERI